MIKIKHLLDEKDSEDGLRIWVEPVGVTRDLRELCSIDHLLHATAPPRALWQWLAGHPNDYHLFRAHYHAWLGQSAYRRLLRQLARSARRHNLTFVHQGDDPDQNTAAALRDFLVQLQARAGTDRRSDCKAF